MLIHYRDRRRTLAALLLIVGAGLLAFSLAGPWWQLDFIVSTFGAGGTGQVSNAAVVFSLSGGVHCTVTNWGAPNPCTGSGTHVVGAAATLDLVLDAGFLALAVAGGTAGVLAALGGVGIAFGRWQLTLAILLALLVGVGGLALPLSAAAAGPGPQANGFCDNWSQNYTSCSYFWGGATIGPYPNGCAMCANVINWGPAAAWYLSVVAGALGALGAYLLWIGRRGPFTQREVEAWAAERGYVARPGPAPAIGPGPPVAPDEAVAPPPAARPIGSALPAAPQRRSAWRCSRCGAANAPWAAACGRCRAPSPYAYDLAPGPDDPADPGGRRIR